MLTATIHQRLRGEFVRGLYFLIDIWQPGLNYYHGSTTRVGEGYGAYWKFSAIVMELCHAP